jgi:hypothetical protein
LLTLSNLQQVNATTYTATFTGAANTDIGSPVAGFRPIRAATALPAGNPAIHLMFAERLAVKSTARRPHGPLPRLAHKSPACPPT